MPCSFDMVTGTSAKEKLLDHRRDRKLDPSSDISLKLEVIWEMSVERRYNLGRNGA